LIFLNDSLTNSVWAQVLREIDLAGATVRETNIPRINEQLVARGKTPVLGFSHEAVRLPNDHTLVLAYDERILTDVQDPGPVDVLGDMIIDLDENLQVVWSWSTFDQLDTRRTAPLGEQCSLLIIGCPPLQLAARANDWTHANSISYLPADGNLLLSMRNQDWVIKIDYANGTGAVLWRLGRDGDFTIESDDPYAWFTHQHDVQYEGGQLTVFDNGNTRCNSGRVGCNSRGQALRIDEQARVATLELNADLGRYAEAFGSAQKLANGNFHFTVGTQDTGLMGQSIETLPDGGKAYVLQTNAVMYRSFRMLSLYMP
jgi:hypothetical protein